MLARNGSSQITTQPSETRPEGLPPTPQVQINDVQNPFPARFRPRNPGSYHPFLDGLTRMYQQKGLTGPMEGIHQQQVTNRLLDGLVTTAGQAFGPMPYFNAQGKLVGPSTGLAPPVSAPSDMLPPLGHVPASARQKLRMCGAVDCSAILPAQFPHLRCRRCRENNVPRKPELKGVVTPAQHMLKTLSSLTGSAASARVPLPSRASLRNPWPSVGAVPAKAVVEPAPTSTSACELAESESDAGLSLESLLEETNDYPIIDDPDIDPNSLELSYPDTPDADPLPPLSQSAASQETAESLPQPLLPTSPNSSPATETPLLPKRSPLSVPPLPAASTSASFQKQFNPYPPTSSDVIPLPSRKRRKISRTGGNPIAPRLAKSDEASPSRLPPLPSRPPPPLPTRFKVHPTPRKPNVSQKPVNKETPASARSCSTADCTNLVTSDSVASRCPQCIMRQWKSKKADAILKETVKKHRVVSWADEVNNGDSTLNEDSGEESVTRVESESERASSTDTADTCIRGWDSDLSEVSSSSESGSDDVDSSDEGESEVDSSESEDNEASPPAAPTGLKIRIPARPLPLATSGSSDLVEASPTTAPAELSPTPGSMPETPIPSAPSSRETPPLPSRVSKPLASGHVDVVDGGRLCANAPKCKQSMSPEYRWKLCISCRARAREYQRKRQNLQGRHEHLDAELALHHMIVATAASSSSSPAQPKVPVPALPSPSRTEPIADPLPAKHEDPKLGNSSSLVLMPGARLCSVKQCPQILPPLQEYIWKMCSRCRQRCGRKKLQREESASDGRPDSPGKADSSSNAPESLRPGAQTKRPDGRCVSDDCGVLVDPNSSWAYCKQCRLRDLRAVKRRNQQGQVQQRAESGLAKLSIRIPSIKQRRTLAEKPRPPAPYPEYRSLPELLTNFKKLVVDFFEVQLVHHAFKGIGEPPELSRSLFSFDGEFSTVALDFNIVGRKDVVDRTVMGIKQEIQQAGKLGFGLKRWVSLFDQGIVTRFVCSRDVAILLPVATPSSAEPPIPQHFMKHMQGELEISVLVDHSHRFFPGERTVVRFRLIG